jgi:hypothetical protein
MKFMFHENPYQTPCPYKALLATWKRRLARPYIPTVRLPELCLGVYTDTAIDRDLYFQEFYRGL